MVELLLLPEEGAGGEGGKKEGHGGAGQLKQNQGSGQTRHGCWN